MEASVSSRTRNALTAGGFVVAVVAAATGIEIIRDGHAQSRPAAEAQATGAATRSPQSSNVVMELSQAFRDAARSVLPAVVSIDVEGRQRVSQVPSPFRGLPFDFSPRDDQSRPMFGHGSGFVFRGDGYILTNNHVVESADRVTVRFQDGRSMTAKVIGRDPQSDVAVVKVDATDLPSVNLGSTETIDVGDWVIALGFPLQLQGTATVTAGIVSAMGRNLNILDRNEDVNQSALEHFIQTDAAINPGNSGGPLIDLNGRVIGVNSAIASPTGYFSGYGFAIPINIARNVASDIIEHGEVRRPRLGVSVGTVTEADRDVLKLPSLEGAKVSQVQENTPASKAGIELGDVIVAVNSQRVRDGGDLTALLAEKYEPGDKVTLEIMRYGRKLTREVELGAFEPVVSRDRVADQPAARGAEKLGFSASDITPRIARELGLAGETRGVVVTEVDPYGSARGVLGEGMVIEQVNGTAIRSVDDLDRVANTVKPGDAVSIIVRIDGNRTMINYRIRD
jgi:serine protease Do